MPCWYKSVVHQNGGRKILCISGTNFGYLGDWLSVLKKQALFLHEISIYFSTNASYVWGDYKICFRFQNLMAKRITSTSRQNKYEFKKCPHGIEEILPWAFFFSLPWGFLFVVSLFLWPWGYSFCREVVLFAVRLSFLLRGFLFTVRLFLCHEVNSFGVTVVGHR